MYDENAYIYDQIVDADTEVLVGRNSVKYDGVYGKAYTIKQFPEEVTIVDAMAFIGDAFRNELQIACPFLLTLNLSVQGEEIKTKQNAKAEFLHKQKIASSLSV